MKLEGIVKQAQTVGDKTRFKLETPSAKKSGIAYEGWYLSDNILPLLRNGHYVRGETEYDRAQRQRIILDPQLPKKQRLEPRYELHLPLRMLEVYETRGGSLLHTYIFSRLEWKR